MRVQIVSFHCILKNTLGEFISSSFNQDVVTTADPDQVTMLPEFVETLRALKNGERREIVINADRAYGYYDPELVAHLPRKQLRGGSGLKLGEVVQAALAEGIQRTYRVTSCTSTHVTLDANHQLAGQDLIFDVEMVSSHEDEELSGPFALH